MQKIIFGICVYAIVQPLMASLRRHLSSTDEGASVNPAGVGSYLVRIFDLFLLLLPPVTMTLACCAEFMRLALRSNGRFGSERVAARIEYGGLNQA